VDAPAAPTGSGNIEKQVRARPRVTGEFAFGDVAGETTLERVQAPLLERVHAHLLDWYAANRRDLPWRRTRDPYAILVAEVMLQQTQVDRVIPRWHAWLERFPTLADLAAASPADAIRAWQGLGYNLRALRLHAVARQVVAEFDGRLPRSVAGLLGLKGVGRYTAGAVACFAYEQPVAMVDTNVRRVLSRVFGVEPNGVEAFADGVIPAGNAYAWHQALMDLGATVCTSRRPMCLVCPLVAECAGPGVPGSARAKPQGEFQGSRRYYRGRIVDVLRRIPTGTGVPVHELADSVAPKAERERVVALIAQLAIEGMLTIDVPGPGGRVRLPD
jgi:A/G-specific adenine glycosylase